MSPYKTTEQDLPPPSDDFITTDIDKLSELVLLTSILELMKNNQPIKIDHRGYCDCNICGFPLDGNVDPSLIHHKYKNHLRTESQCGCEWLQAIANLQAIIIKKKSEIKEDSW